MRYYDSLGAAGYPISGGDSYEQSFQSHLDRGSLGGIDYGVGVGHPIYAPTKGRVLNRSTTGGGNTARFYHIDDSGAETGWYDEFLHLSAFGLDGAIFSPGDDIGARSGNTGTQTTGPHVHWHLVDPQGNRQRQWLFFQEDKKKRRDMIAIQHNKDGAVYLIGAGFIHHCGGAEWATLAATYGPTLWVDSNQLKSWCTAHGVPVDKPAAVLGGKTWSREQEILDVVNKGGGTGYTPAEIAAAVNNDVAKRMSA